MISVSRLSKTYPDGTEAVRAVDFDVAPGEVFGLLGPNGAGKSTTIGMLTTTIRPTGGTARLAGFDVAEKLCDRLAIMHAGRIVALDTPAALLASLGREIVELRVSGDAEGALASLRAHGIVDGDGFAVGSTLTLPLHERSAADAIAAIGDTGVTASSISTRRP